MSLKSFTLLDELSLEGSLCKSVQGECCAASLLAGITEPQPRMQRVNSEAPYPFRPPSRRAPRTLREEIHLVKRNSRFEEEKLIKSIWWKIIYNSPKKAYQRFCRSDRQTLKANIFFYKKSLRRVPRF